MTHSHAIAQSAQTRIKSKSIPLLFCMLVSTFIMSTVHASPAEYFVGKYRAVGYDALTKTPYTEHIQLKKSDTHFLAVRYRFAGVTYAGYLEKVKGEGKQRLTLTSYPLDTKKQKPKKTKRSAQTSDCHYLHNAGSMSAEINCHGSLIGSKGYFSLVMY